MVSGFRRQPSSPKKGWREENQLGGRFFQDTARLERMVANSALSSVPVKVSTVDGAAELYVVNHAYALVATGVGSIDVMLPPGDYKVRQRVGYLEAISSFKVPKESPQFRLDLPKLAFPTPIPIQGTSLSSVKAGSVRPLAIGEGSFRLVLRIPVGGRRELEPNQVERLRSELAHLRVERFWGATGVDLTPPFMDTMNGTLVACGDLAPGPYVLVQQLSEQTRCMPIWVVENCVTAVFLLALSDGDERIPANLDHAAVAIFRAADLDTEYQDALLQLEAARKAMSVGRAVFGWTKPEPSNPRVPSFNPVLALMDAHQGIRKVASKDAAELDWIVEKAERVLGTEFPDVVALRSFLAASEDGGKGLHLLAGPPLLRRSWELLLASQDGDAALARLMPFRFQLEGNSTWLTWIEEAGAREGLTEGAVIFGLPLPRRPMGKFVRFGEFIRWQPGDFKLDRFGRGEVVFGREHETVELVGRNIVEILSDLLQSGILQRWLDIAQQLVARDSGDFRDESIQGLVAALQSVTDPTLIRMFGPEELVRQALASMKMPKQSVEHLVEELLDRLLNSLSDSDRWPSAVLPTAAELASYKDRGVH